MKIKTQLLFDKISIGVSTLCAVQCALMPILLVVYPNFFWASVDEHLFHLLLIWLVLPTSALAGFLGCSKHKDVTVLLGIVLGLSTLVFTAIFGHHYFGEFGEKLATIAAALVLAMAHWRNYKLCRKNDCTVCPDD
jgi:hypothetical protein